MEEYLINKGICEKAKLSNKMSIETLKEVQDTLQKLVNTNGLPPLNEIKYSPGKCNMFGSVATYEWSSKTMYLSNKTNDAIQYIKDRVTSEENWKNFRKTKNLDVLSNKFMKEAVEEMEKEKDAAHKFLRNRNIKMH